MVLRYTTSQSASSPNSQLKPAVAKTNGTRPRQASRQDKTNF